MKLKTKKNKLKRMYDGGKIRNSSRKNPPKDIRIPKEGQEDEKRKN